MNALGQVTHELTANGVETIQTRNPSTGWLRASSSTAHADNETLIQQWGYSFDEAGNLRTRTRSDQLNALGSVETFGYDGLDRLTSSNVTVGATQQASGFGYDALGNLTTKDGKDYAYTGCVAGERPAGPHAVCYVGGVGPFLYDGNGNMVSGLDRTLTYNPSNMVTHVDSHPAVSNGNDTGTVDFMYGADNTRVVQAVSGPNGASARTIYVGLGGTGKSLYERTTNGATTEHVHFIYAGGAHTGNAFALRVITEGGTSQPTTSATKYNHFDHLGSITAVSDESGHVINPDWGGADAGVMGYDPWGARRSPDGRAANPASFDLPVGRRGFTSQETIPNVGLINMNGRVYDPVVGRFLSPDPTIQFPTDLQDYNRYSYVKNNPLRYTDPTGFFLTAGFDQLVSFGIAMVAIGVCAGSEGAGCGIAFALIGAAYNATSMAASGASFEQVVNSLVISAGFGFIGGAVAGGAGEAAFGQTLTAKIVGGAIGGAFSGLAGGVAAGDKLSDLGVNVFEGAVQGANSAAMSWTIEQTLALSLASAADAQGDIEGGWASDRKPNSESSRNGPLRAQDKNNSCVPAATRNAIWLKTNVSISEAAIRAEMDPDPDHDWNDVGINATEAIPVLKNHGVSAVEIEADTPDDLARNLKGHAALMIGGNKGGQIHRMILLGIGQGPDGTTFKVIDSLSAPAGYAVRVETWSSEKFNGMWDHGAPIIKF
jgi:RHS repeat-associated protein